MRIAPRLLTPLLVCAALAACSSSTPGYGSAAPAATSSAAPTTASSSASPSASSAPTPTPAPTSSAPGATGGEITFTGALSGRMTASACHDGMAQLVVSVQGRDQTYNGLIDADDFTFAVPHSTGYTLADQTSKPSVSGTTYTVRNTKLVSITDDDTITANGSVTCP